MTTYVLKVISYFELMLFTCDEFHIDMQHVNTLDLIM